MIVAIKKRLALIIATALESFGIQVKVIQSGFNEDTDNKPLVSKQITIVHRDSTVTLKSAKDGSYITENRFDLTLTVKDLRSDDTVQNVVSIIATSLIGSNFGGIPIKELTIDNQGYDNGIWKYLISFIVTLNSIDDKDDDDKCLLDGVTDLNFTVNISPKYN